MKLMVLIITQKSSLELIHYTYKRLYVYNVVIIFK